MTETQREGGCLCGAIRYRAPATPLAVSACHCRDCQKQSGSALSVLAVFPRDAVAFTGEPARYEGRGSSGRPVLRYFCPSCGSPLYSDNEAMQARGIIAVKAGTLDDVGDLTPAAHYWTVSKHDWVTIAEGSRCLERE